MAAGSRLPQAEPSSHARWRFGPPCPSAAPVLACALVLAVCGAAAPPPGLFAELRGKALKPRPEEECMTQSSVECLTEYHQGRYEGSQQHRAMEQDEETTASLRPPHVRLLLLMTTAWRNFQRRRLQRAALYSCRLLMDPSAVMFMFLLGEVPEAYRARAVRELADFDDILLTGAADEMAYSHVGDAYVLKEPSPELNKLVLALRALRPALSFDYLLVADDDSFVSLTTLVDLANMLSPERVYMGIMIDTIPQRPTEGDHRIVMEYGVGVYLATTTKVPVFAHGMAFLVSQDLAWSLAEVGLSLKMRGNEDMIFGFWVRSFEKVYYLNYHTFFADHNEFPGLFSRPCEETQVVVHRMNPERWRSFDPWVCHICGPPRRPPDTGPDPPPAPPAAPAAAAPRCVAAADLACRWRSEEARRWSAEAADVGLCAERCAAWGATLVPGNRSRAPTRGDADAEQRRCPISVCAALCAARLGGASAVCAEGDPGTGAPPRSAWSHPLTQMEERPWISAGGPAPRRQAVDLAICIFGSQWRHIELRLRLRAALRACEGRRFGVRSARHVFLMPGLPGSSDMGRRQSAAHEVLVHGDIAVMRPPSLDGVMDYRPWPAYGYEHAWRVVEERFGGASFILLLDHRSFVNVPGIVHGLLPRIPTERLYLGCFLDHTLFGLCSGRGSSRCDYLIRRRAPYFAHGMGILVSADVARFVADLSRRTPLRRDDVPADVAFAMWAHLMEGLEPQSWHWYFHEHPADGSTYIEGALPGLDGGPELSQPTMRASMVVWPMTRRRWGRFDAETCTLAEVEPLEAQGVEDDGEVVREDAVAREQVVAQELAVAKEKEAEREEAENLAAAEAPAVDCWRGMGGRPEAWHLVCCELHWERCWGGSFTAEVCCQRPVATPPPTADGAEAALRRFLRFDEGELRFFLHGLGNASAAAAEAGGAARFGCGSPRDCAQEAFARFYQRAWEVGLLPLRHPWLTDTDDHLFGLALKLREENSGWGPRGQEHTLERVQLAEWLRLAAEHIQPEEVPGERRCLEWDSSQYSRHFFRGHCAVMDVIAYAGGETALEQRDGGHRRYVVDVHVADKVVPADSAGVVICTQVFEHLLRPFDAMAQLFRLLAPGGFVVWSAPLFSEIHGSPDDYFRYTPMGARALAEGAGFEVVGQYSPGSLRELAGYFLGLTAPYWRREDLLADSGSSWPLQVYMLLRKPPRSSR